MVGTAQLGALALELANLGRGDLQPVGLAGDHVELDQERGHPERVDDVAGVEDELDALVDRQVEHRLRRPRHSPVGVELGVDATGVDVVIDVVEVPAPLLGHDVDRVVGLLRHVHEGGLVTRRVVEQHGDHEDRHDRIEQLDRHVVAQLGRQFRIVLLAPVGDHAPDRQAPDEGADREAGDPGAHPQRGDPTRLARDVRSSRALRQPPTGGAAVDIGTTGKEERGGGRQPGNGQSPPRDASGGVCVLTQRAPSEYRVTARVWGHPTAMESTDHGRGADNLTTWRIPHSGPQRSLLSGTPAGRSSMPRRVPSTGQHARRWPRPGRPVGPIRGACTPRAAGPGDCLMRPDPCSRRASESPPRR